MQKGKENRTILSDKIIIRTSIKYDPDVEIIEQEISNNYD